ncbi:unnamed protein product [Gongylonema pulchrum]|uniref:Folylpolyglutamate synthase n=1 Tax=Gongylonema pulchrum TaxID=637853 RepID=A0A183E671_9BILA|nr:unnamed protein product [Gongylonema pulchrum]
MLFIIFQKCGFDRALFCPARLQSSLDVYNDQTNLMNDNKEQIAVVANHADHWRNLIGVTSSDSTVEEFDCIQKAIERIEEFECLKHGERYNDEIVVLVTGSLHLVGGVLAFIDREIDTFA